MINLSYRKVADILMERNSLRSTDRKRDSYYPRHIRIYSRHYICIGISSAMGRDNLARATILLPIFLYRTLSRNSPGKYMRLAKSTRTQASKEDNGRFKQRITIKRMYRSRNRNKRGQLTVDLLRQRTPQTTMVPVRRRMLRLPFGIRSFRSSDYVAPNSPSGSPPSLSLDLIAISHSPRELSSMALEARITRVPRWNLFARAYRTP